MIPFLLTSAGTFLYEFSIAKSKKAIQENKESYYQMGILQLFYPIIFFLITLLQKGNFHFSTASLPTFLLRVILEIIQIEVLLHAIVKAERSTFSFLRLLTIPLLIIVDIYLGYHIKNTQLIGITVLVSGLTILYIQKQINKKGALLVVLSAIIAVITISLFKFNITHFNSLIAEQLTMYSILIVYLIIRMKLDSHTSILKTLTSPSYQIQAFLYGGGVFLINFAYLYGTASVVTTLERITSVLWSIFFGNLMLKEKGLSKKIIFLLIMAFGLILLLN